MCLSESSFVFGGDFTRGWYSSVSNLLSILQWIGHIQVKVCSAMRLVRRYCRDRGLEDKNAVYVLCKSHAACRILFSFVVVLLNLE